MSRLAVRLQNIDEIISIKKFNLDHYMNDFAFIHEVILRCMCLVDPVFASLFHSTLLVGSVPLKMRLYMPTEFDVLFNLAFPFHNDLRVIYMTKYPGFLQLDLSTIMRKMKHNPSNYLIYKRFQKLVDPHTFILNRAYFQMWLKEVFINTMIQIKYRVLNSNGDIFQLYYKPRGPAHTIIAHKNGGTLNGGLSIKIDFIGTILFQSLRFYQSVLYATPRGAMQSSIYDHDHSFFICNANAEIIYFQRAPSKLLSVARLLKFTCASKRVSPHFKSYYIVNALLWEMTYQPPYFWFQPLDVIFVHVMNKIIFYLENCYLPFYWNQNFNLLCYLSYEDCFNYKNVFKDTLEKFINVQFGGE